MRTKTILIAGIAAASFATPSVADFFIVRDGTSGPCRVVDTRPTDGRSIVIGNKTYTARAEAERDIGTVCPSTRAGDGSVAPPSAAVVVPPAVATPLVTAPGAQAPLVAAPAVPVPVPETPCFWQGRAFSSGSTNPPGETCVKGRWQ
jgi:hypothetical protein